MIPLSRRLPPADMRITRGRCVSGAKILTARSISLAAFSPWRHGNTSTSEYRWQDGQLALIELNVYGKPPEHIRARFDAQGELSFMQREIDGQKQQLSSDQVALYRYRAEQIRQTSDALRQGRVMLRQGRWHANRTVTTCEGQTVKPDLDTQALAHIERRQNHSSIEVSVAWLEAPEGSSAAAGGKRRFLHLAADRKKLLRSAHFSESDAAPGFSIWPTHPTNQAALPAGTIYACLRQGRQRNAPAVPAVLSPFRFRDQPRTSHPV
ncbi:lipoprotein [Klebsiella michiganensis]|nr:lipoprotein [Klebsiella michiganensis]